jgi:stress response protein YsnF
MRVEALLMLVVMNIKAMSAIDFTVKMYDNTPGLYYDHVGHVRLCGSEWKLVTYVNISNLEDTYNTVLDFVSQTKGMCKELSSESTSICQSHLLLIEQSLSQVYRTRVIIAQVTKTKEDENFSAGRRNSNVRDVFFTLLVLLKKILFGTLSDENATYYKNRISELQSEQLSMLRLAKEQIIVVRSSLKTANFTLADVAANEMQPNDNINVIHNQVAENGETTSQAFSQAILLSAVNQHMIIFEHLVRQLRKEYDIFSAITFAQKGILLPQIIIPEDVIEAFQQSQPILPTDLSLPSTARVAYKHVLMDIVDIDVF